MARLEECDDKNHEILLVPHKGQDAPQGIVYNTPIKIQIRQRKNGSNQMIIIDGTVITSSKAAWRIRAERSVTYMDTRKAFRQRIQVAAEVICTVRGMEQHIGCELEDISSSGVGFQSTVKLKEGRVVRLEIPFLLEGGPSYSFSCRVMTCREYREGLIWRYGCMFEDMDEREEDQLCGDIFQLQAKTLGRNT